MLLSTNERRLNTPSNASLQCSVGGAVRTQQTTSLRRFAEGDYRGRHQCSAGHFLAGRPARRRVEATASGSVEATRGAGSRWPMRRAPRRDATSMRNALPDSMFRDRATHRWPAHGALQYDAGRRDGRRAGAPGRHRRFHRRARSNAPLHTNRRALRLGRAFGSRWPAKRPDPPGGARPAAAGFKRHIDTTDFLIGARRAFEGPGRRGGRGRGSAIAASLTPSPCARSAAPRGAAWSRERHAGAILWRPIWILNSARIAKRKGAAAWARTLSDSGYPHAWPRSAGHPASDGLPWAFIAAHYVLMPVKVGLIALGSRPRD